MFKNAQVNDRVWDSRYGWGTVKAIYSSNVYPIKVKFNYKNLKKDYTFDGKSSMKYIYPVLFWNEFDAPDEAFIKPLPKLKVDTKVLVWDNETQQKRKRYFYEFTDSGLIRTYSKGATSFSTYMFIETWQHWELYE